jgi:hypothetical protein
MDMDEARRLLERHMEGLGARSYRELEARIGQAAAEQIDLGHGRSYTIEVEVVRDGPEGGNIRVLGAIDDGRAWASISPLCSDFIMAPDGSLVGELPDL